MAFDILNHGIFLERLLRLGVGASFSSRSGSSLMVNPRWYSLEKPCPLLGPVPWDPTGIDYLPNAFTIYMKPLGEGIQRFGVCCHQYTGNMHLNLYFSSSADDAVQVLECCLTLVWK